MESCFYYKGKVFWNDYNSHIDALDDLQFMISEIGQEAIDATETENWCGEEIPKLVRLPGLVQINTKSDAIAVLKFYHKTSTTDIIRAYKNILEHEEMQGVFFNKAIMIYICLENPDFIHIHPNHLFARYLIYKEDWHLIKNWRDLRIHLEYGKHK